jgi:hypothetical protein
MRTEGEANHIEDIQAPSFLRKNEAFLALPSKSQKRRWRKKQSIALEFETKKNIKSRSLSGKE